MTYAGDSSIDARVRAVEEDYRRRQSRLFITFALIELPVLVILAVLVYGLEVVDPEIGVWFLAGAAFLGGSALSMLLLRHIQGRTRAIAQARGENPLF